MVKIFKLASHFNSNLLTIQSLFFFLQKCDVTKAEKSCAETAKRIIAFIGKMNLTKFLPKMTFTSDHALYQTMGECMAKEGVNVEVNWNVCGSHNAVNICTAANSEFNNNVKEEDTLGKSSFLLSS